MTPRRKRFKPRKDPKLVLGHQLPMRWSTTMIERAEMAAQIVSERDHKHVTATEVLRDGGNLHVDAILAAHRSSLPDGSERRQEPRRQQDRRLTPPSIAKAG